MPMTMSEREQDGPETVAPSNPVDPTPIACDDSAETCDEIDLRSLPAGTLCLIDTRNSRYRLIPLGRGSEVLVEGGKHFTELATAPVAGSIVSGHQLRPGLITVGQPMEIVEGARRVVTSCVRAIRLAAA